jgi:glycerol uptake facilitator-like aquaporin
MVKGVFQDASSFYKTWIDVLPPGLLLSLAAGGIGDGKYFKAYRDEFIGTIMMICFTFSAGKWIGQDSISVAWACHVVGVIAADYLSGGQQVNPAVTLSMWALEKINYTEAFVRIAGQMGGGLISFPLFHALSDTLKLKPFGGPEFKMENNAEAAMSEFVATYWLLWAIYILNWELNFGRFHYIIKQVLTAVVIRILIEVFPTAGPAMNPMLATCWDVFGVGNSFEFPKENEHYFVYWLSPFVAALLASFSYVIYAGGRVFGKNLPIGPIKKNVGVPSINDGKKSN